MSKQIARFLLLFLWVVVGYQAGAQTDQTGRDNSLLPDIDPQDIEIRGEFRARFPGLRRQPILGFSPKPRVYQIDPQRMPFLESSDQIVANLPVSEISRPKPPRIHLFSFPQSNNWFARGGFGSFVSPEGALYGSAGLSETSWLLLSSEYHSSDGHLDLFNTGFRFFDGQATYLTRPKPDRQWRVKAGWRSDAHYGLQLPVANSTTINSPARKEYLGFSGGLGYEKLNNPFSGFQFALDGYYQDIAVSQWAADASNTEFGGDLELRKQWAGEEINRTYSFALLGEAGQYQINQAGDTEMWQTYKAEAGWKALFSFDTELSILVRGGLFANEQSDATLFVLPDIAFSHLISDRLKLKLTARGDVDFLSNRDHMEINRFLHPFQQLQHSRTLEGIAEADYQVSPRTLVTAGASYTRTADYAFYRYNLLSGSDPTSGFYDVQFADMVSPKVFAGFTHYLIPKRFWVDAEVYLQDPEVELAGTTTEVPIIEKFGSEITASYDTGRRLQGELWGRYLASRPSAGTVNGPDDILLLGATIDFDITKRFSIYAKVLNILGQEYAYWTGYQERPRQAYAGVTVSF